MTLLLTALFFLVPALINGEAAQTQPSTTSSISSKKAVYDGSALVLNGDVELEHALGKMVSGAARLEKEDKDGPFSSIFLRDKVLITLKNLGKISCATADLNFTAMTGKLLPEAGKLIQFVNLDSQLFSLSSKQAEMAFIKESDTLKIVKIDAEGQVQVQYGTDFTLDADHATYSNETAPYLYATPNCKLAHFEDLIEADKVELFPKSSTVILSSPKGTLKSLNLSKDTEMQFACNRMIWENIPQIITLQGDVSVTESGIGTLQCEEEVELRQKQHEGKWRLSSLVAKGKTELTYGLDASFKHLLICYGLMQLDHDRLILTLESGPNRPIEYFHNHLKLKSEQGQLEYSQNENQLEPHLLQLSGNVQLSPVDNESRYALADQFIYLPPQEKIILSAKGDGNVLFWDKEKGVSISAREVHIDRLEKRETVKGIGNVRFAFSSTENALLKKVFPFYKTEGMQ